mgnify:CR=1 FL=1
MSDLDNESYDTKRSMATLVKMSCTSKSIMIQPPLNYHAVKRLIQVDDDESISPNEDSDDALGEEICSAAEELAFSETQGSIELSVDPAASIAALFDSESDEAKQLKARLWLAWDLSEDSPSIVGILTACQWTRDRSLSTDKFTQAFLSEHSIPRFNSNDTLLVDVVSSGGEPHGVGALLLLTAYLLVCRSSRLRYIACVAVSDPGRTLCEKLGFNSYSYRERGAQRRLCWAEANELRAKDINRRLRVNRSLPSLCWRDGLSARTQGRKIPRC